MPFTQRMLEEPVSGSREGEVSLGCCMPLRQPSGDASSQLFFKSKKFWARYEFGSHLYI